MFRSVPKFAIAVSALTALAAALLTTPTSVAQSVGDKHVSGVFTGGKVNGGTVIHRMTDGKHTLTLSDGFKSPDTPDPHWQVVDSNGNVYLLNRLMIKGGIVGGDKLNQTIAIPAYVADVARVQIWCAWAEAVLGEASFATPVK
jgi:hypothetical protein